MTPHGYVRSPYTQADIDAVAAYCSELDRVYLLPAELVVGKHMIHLRLAAPKNGQRAGLNWASSHELSGAIAQLGERCRGTAEAAGSSPASSTPSGDHEVGAHEFRNLFGWYMQRAAAGETFLVKRRGKPYARLVPAQEPLTTIPLPEKQAA